MGQEEFLRIFCLTHPKVWIIGSIGSISYDLTNIPHRRKILLRGAMGSALGAGFGFALARPKEKVVIVIGEGSLLMQLGAISTILKYNLPNLKILVMNNGVYASCGGQTNNFSAVEPLIKSQRHIFEIFSPEIAPKPKS